MSAASWILLLAALAGGSWVETDALGTAGCFCSSPAVTNTSSGCVGTASFGLWKYCVSPLVPAYGNKPYPVCFKYTDIITTGNIDALTEELSEYGKHMASAHPEFTVSCSAAGMVGDGNDRFDQWNAKSKRLLTAWLVISAIACVMVGDVYSEKLMICCILNLVATGLGLFAMIMFIEFFQKLSLGTDGRMSLGASGKLLVLGFMGSLATAALYGKDWLCNMKILMEVTDHKGNVVRIYENSSDESDDSVRYPSDSEKKEKKKEKKKKKKKSEPSFDAVDLDGDGKISIKEMKKAGINAEDRDDADADDDGKLSKKEFKKAQEAGNL